jgi:carbonic anhydrase
VNDIEALIEGFKAFKNESEQSGQGKYHNLAEYGPHSKILMVACCDSRVDPAIITNSSAGDLMVIRNIANLVPPYHPDSSFKETQAAIEFAVCYRRVEHIIVMGHSRCAGIRSLLTRLLDFGNPIHSLDKWTVVAEPAGREVLQEFSGSDLDEQSCQASRKALALSLENLKSYPSVADRLEKQTLQLHGWYFSLSSGALERYVPSQQQFESLY